MLVKRLDRVFLDHPRAVGETYGEHLWQATRVGASLIVVAFACFVHAVFPGLFVSTASNKIRSLAAQIDKRLGVLQVSAPPETPSASNPSGDYSVPLLMSEKNA